MTTRRHSHITEFVPYEDSGGRKAATKWLGKLRGEEQVLSLFLVDIVYNTPVESMIALETKRSGPRDRGRWTASSVGVSHCVDPSTTGEALAS